MSASLRAGDGAVSVAADGVADADAPMPHAAEIQASFGEHDVSHVRASVGGAGRAAAERIGARAYALGDRVAFAQPPSLRLAAHEAAHVIQQQRGVHPEGGVGRPGDSHERHADAVADAVVAGRSASALLSAGSAGAPQVALQRAPAKVSHDVLPDGTDTLHAFMVFRGELLLLELRPDAETANQFDAQTDLRDKLGAALTAAFEPGGQPVPETAAFVRGPLVRRLIEDDLPAWVLAPDSSLAALAAVLEHRAAEFRKQAVRVDLEAYLGVSPGTIDWAAALPGLHDDFDVKGDTSPRWQSLRDRGDFVLLVLETEIAAAPPVVGGVTPPNLSDSVWTFAMDFRLAEGTSSKAFSEKYLNEYVPMIAALEFVPAGFDLERFKPGGTDLAADERHRILDQWIAANAAEATTKIVLDDWTTSGLDFHVYLANFDLDARKDVVLDKLTDAFLKAAKGDRELDRALLRMADAQATYAMLARLVTAGRAAEKHNHELAAAIDDPDPTKHSGIDDLIGDPRTIYEGEFYIAQATKQILSNVQGGARVDFELISGASAIAGKANIPETFGVATFLLAALAELSALAGAKDAERAHAREDIAARVDLSWGAIKKIIDDRGKEADRFLDETWIPMLKTVAGEWVAANYEELKKAHDDFDEWVPKTVGNYRLAAWMIEDTANQLESGEIESSTLGGATVTIDNVEELRTSVAVLRGKADQLDSPDGREEKHDELEKAIEAYERVQSNIADGTYKPKNYGEEVVVEAKKRLKIGLFEATTLWQQATRQVSVKDNPFQAYTVAMWRVENIIDDAVSTLLGGFLRGALTIGSLLVPGVGGLVLAAIDIGIGLYGSAKNIGEAGRRLDLARLDTQLNIQGVSVEDAQHALNMAWVSFAIELVMAGLFSALAGKMALKGIERWRMPHFTKLAEADSALAAKLLERVGDAKLTDTLLGHFAGDGNKLFEALAYVNDAKSLATLVSRVKDAELLASLLRSCGSDKVVVELLDKFKDVRRLDTLLGKATPNQLLQLLAHTKDEAVVAKLVEGMGPYRSLSLLESGLTAEHAIALDRLGDDAVRAFARIAATGDAEAIEGVSELLRLKNSKGTYSNDVAVSALEKTADFTEKYAGRASGDFVSRFARVAKDEASVAKIQGKIDELKNAGRSTANAERQLAGAEAALARAKAETNAATDILEGKTVFGEGRKVRALPESKVEGVETPEFAVTGGGRPDALAEVKAIGDETGKIGKDVIQRNFRKAASQISEHAAATGQKGGLVRLDAGNGTIPQTNADIAAQVNGQWKDALRSAPARAGDVAWVEVLDRSATGAPQRLLLKVESTGVTIEATGTTRP